MKKICEIIVIAVMMSCMCIYSVSADGGYVLSKGLIIGSEIWKITDYCGAPYGEYKDMIDEVLEEEKCANYCMLYFSIADKEDEAFAMLAGKNELGEEEITLWNTEIGFADSLVWYAKMLGVYDSFSDLQDEGTEFIIVGDFRENGRIIAGNSLMASACSQAMEDVIDGLLK